jgi:hypothetical protein
MGTNETAPPAGLRTRQESRRTDEPFSRVRPESHRGRGTDEPISRVRPHTNNANTSGATFESASGHKKTQKVAQEVAELQDATENVVAEFQIALTAREKELEEKQAKYNTLVRSYDNLREANKTQANTIAQRDSDAKATTDLLNTVITKHLLPYAQTSGCEPAKWNRNSFLAVFESLSKDAADAKSSAAEAISYAADISSLTEQVGMLQKEMLAKVEKIHVASDEQFAQEFRVIVSLVKTLSRTIRIDDTMEVAESLGAGPLQKNVSHHHWASRARKKLLIEAWVWSVLLHWVFCNPFAILGKQCDMLSQVWRNIFRNEHCNGWPSPTSLSEAWRCTTMESMLESVDRAVITQGKVSDVPNKVEIGITNTRQEVLDFVGKGLSKISVKIDGLQIEQVVDKAFAFAVQMSIQRVRLQVTYPKVEENFNTDTMKFIPDPDGEDVDDGLVAFVVNPGLTKWGDSHGKNLDHRYDIVPSFVQLEHFPQQKVPEPKAGLWANVAKRGYEEATAPKDRNGGESQR